MTEHMEVYIGFHSGRVKALVLLGYSTVSLDECPAWWCHLQGSNSSTPEEKTTTLSQKQWAPVTQ